MFGDPLMVYETTLQKKKLLISTVHLVHAPRHLKDIGAVDLNLLNRLVATANTDASKLVNDILALHNLAENGVLAVKVRGRTKSDTKRYCQRREILQQQVMIRLQELGAVGARAGVGHAEGALAVVPERRDELVLELATVD
jgi:hypothetical protein